MTPAPLHDLFLGAAGVAGALIGLLFVAISVEHDRLTAADANQVDLVRARAALSSFTNALAVSLFALAPDDLGWSSAIAGLLGLVFVCGGILSVRRVARAGHTRTGRMRDLAFLAALLLVFASEIVWGSWLIHDPHASGPAGHIADCVIASFLVGIYRSWELIGGPEIGLGSELRALIRDHGGSEDQAPTAR